VKAKGLDILEPGAGLCLVMLTISLTDGRRILGKTTKPKKHIDVFSPVKDRVALKNTQLNI